MDEQEDIDNTEAVSELHKLNRMHYLNTFATVASAIISAISLGIVVYLLINGRS